MRATFSELIVQSASKNNRFIALSGDHGYALFDQLRTNYPSQFLNCGVMEQAMVSIAAGLAKEGFIPLVYGLASFVPVRVLEQIKLDVCHSNRSVVFIGDGAGLVYSTLGSSHHSGEDIACLKPLPNMKIFAPGDAYELKISYSEALNGEGPAYIRMGKGDRPSVHQQPLKCSDPVFLKKGESEACLVTMSSMNSIGVEVAQKNKLDHLSIIRLKPRTEMVAEYLKNYKKIIVIEEHFAAGGLASTIAESFFNSGISIPPILQKSLTQKFAHHCGSYQYALSEHGLSDAQLLELKF